MTVDSKAGNAAVARAKARSATDGGSGGGPKRRRLVYATAIVVVAASGWGAWQLVPGDGEGSRPPSERDKVTAAATRQLAALSSMDPARVDERLGWWEQASTGTLRAELARDRAANRKRFAAIAAAATGTVGSLAVTALNAESATVIASVRVKFVGTADWRTEESRRYQAGLTRTPQGWRTSSLFLLPAPDGSTPDGGTPKSGKQKTGKQKTGTAKATGAQQAGRAPAAPAPAAGDAALLGDVTKAAEAVFSYRYQDPAATRQAARDVLVGTAAGQYQRLFGIVADQAPKQRLTVGSKVLRAGVIERAENTVTVLIFLDQTSTREGGRPSFAAIALKVTARAENGRWRISDLRST
ncbi:hypothetical protein ACGFNU_31925 [Spirillospora sp. NPDC048911]|uniref:hypothetical protein n=1 Tax=Spirillospora sp. NPDC048911 TaxID=3364527 RepID=UPI003714C920